VCQAVAPAGLALIASDHEEVVVVEDGSLVDLGEQDLIRLAVAVGVVKELSLLPVVDDVVVAVLGLRADVEIFRSQRQLLVANPTERRLGEIDRVVTQSEIGDGIDVVRTELVLELEDVGAFGARQRITSLAAIENIIAMVAVQRVVAEAALDLVATRPTEKVVLALATPDDVAALAAFELVAAGPTEKLVLALAVPPLILSSWSPP